MPARGPTGLMATTATSGWYPNVTWGHTYSFHVRARDIAGNVSTYTVPGSTQVKDTTPPYEAHVTPLPPPACPVHRALGGRDACLWRDDLRRGMTASTGITWQSWQTRHGRAPSDIFNPASPQYGLTHYFHARAHDLVGNISAWSAAGQHPPGPLHAQRQHLDHPRRADSRRPGHREPG